jgi:predicted MFS family arabinose efflux permease
MSAVQSYVPTEKRGRVNGIFLIMTTVGMLMGRLLSGYLGELFDYQYIVLAMNCISLLAFIFIVLRNRQAIAAVYNRKI